jgi:hypothetical protein
MKAGVIKAGKGVDNLVWRILGQMKIMHGIFNKSDQPVNRVFRVSPTGKLFELFQKISQRARPSRGHPPRRLARRGLPPAAARHPLV